MAVLIGASAVTKGSDSGLLIGVMTVPLTFGLTLLFLKWEQASLRDYSFDLSWWSCVRFCVGLLTGFGLVAAHTLLLTVGGGVHWVQAPNASVSNLLPILGYVLLATREELAFHGYPLRKLASDIDPFVALMIVSILFVVEHRIAGASWTNALLGSGMGSLVFGMAALATKGLALPIGFHAAWNIGDWARGGKGGGGLWRMVVEPRSTGHTTFLIIASYVVVMACALTGFWLWYRRRRCASA